MRPWKISSSPISIPKYEKSMTCESENNMEKASKFLPQPSKTLAKLCLINEYKTK